MSIIDVRFEFISVIEVEGKQFLPPIYFVAAKIARTHRGAVFPKMSLPCKLEIAKLRHASLYVSIRLSLLLACLGVRLRRHFGKVPIQLNASDPSRSLLFEWTTLNCQVLNIA
jgi:hypothetical protein